MIWYLWKVDMYRTARRDCKERLQVTGQTPFLVVFFFLVDLEVRGFSVADNRCIFRENGWGIDSDPLLPCAVYGPVHHCKRDFTVPPF